MQSLHNVEIAAILVSHILGKDVMSFILQRHIHMYTIIACSTHSYLELIPNRFHTYICITFDYQGEVT